MEKIIIVLTTLFLLVISIPAMGQGAPPATPIDGGLSLLLVAGGMYGVKKLINKKRDL